MTTHDCFPVGSSNRLFDGRFPTRCLGYSQFGRVSPRPDGGPGELISPGLLRAYLRIAAKRPFQFHGAGPFGESLGPTPCRTRRTGFRVGHFWHRLCQFSIACSTVPISTLCLIFVVDVRSAPPRRGQSTASENAGPSFVESGQRVVASLQPGTPCGSRQEFAQQ